MAWNKKELGKILGIASVLFYFLFCIVLKLHNAPGILWPITMAPAMLLALFAGIFGSRWWFLLLLPFPALFIYAEVTGQICG